jgi:hypothetical protein
MKFLKVETKFNLQLFAEEEFEEIEDDGYVGEDEDENENKDEIDEIDELDEREEGDPSDFNSEDKKESEKSDEDEIGDEDEDTDGEGKLDKKTKALISYKKESKESKKRIAELEMQLNAKESEKTLDKIVSEKIEAGYSEDEATKFAKMSVDYEKLKVKTTNFEFESLEKRFPLITNHKKDILELQKLMPEASIEDLYIAKFWKASYSDTEKLAQQRLLHSKNDANSKNLEKSDSDKTNTRGKKLSLEDERTFKILRKNNPKITRKKYMELLNGEEIQEE